LTWSRSGGFAVASGNSDERIRARDRRRPGLPLRPVRAATRAAAPARHADFIRRFPIIGGIEPDESLARQWYETAREISLEFLPLSEVQRLLERPPSVTTE
jgi:hypothetical protein